MSESVVEREINFRNARDRVCGRLAVLFPPDLELFPWSRGQLEKITEEGDTLGPRRQLVRCMIPDSSDHVD